MARYRCSKPTSALVGGLLSAHHACGDPVLLARARDLADRLLPAFDTFTGMPYRFVNLRSGAVRGPETNPAEVGTHIAEFGTLSKLTGDRRYRDAAKRAMIAMFERRLPTGLLADAIDANTGQWLSRRATVGPPSDSFYEYAWDGWQLFGDQDCKAMYDTLTAAILKHQVVRRDGHLWFADVDAYTGKPLWSEQDELASFYGGLLAQGGANATGRAYTRSWAGVQDRFGVLPEGYDYATGKPTAVTNDLRPELADAALNHWLLDRRPEWRMIGRAHYLAMKRWNRAAHGYADLADVTTKAQADHCPGYWWSEQMKYYYLLFSDTPRFDYARNYLSTEGNVLLGFRRDQASAMSSAATFAVASAYERASPDQFCVTLPSARLYQLLQCGSAQTVCARSACSCALKRACASALTSSAACPSRSSSASASTAKATCASIM